MGVVFQHIFFVLSDEFLIEKSRERLVERKREERECVLSLKTGGSKNQV
jgi:hypothetical protein